VFWDREELSGGRYIVVCWESGEIDRWAMQFLFAEIWEKLCGDWYSFVNWERGGTEWWVIKFCVLRVGENERCAIQCCVLREGRNWVGGDTVWCADRGENLNNGLYSVVLCFWFSYWWGGWKVTCWEMLHSAECEILRCKCEWLQDFKFSIQLICNMYI